MRTAITLAIGIGLQLLFGSCGQSDLKTGIDGINFGMTRPEAQQLLGAPTTTETNGHRDLLRWDAPKAGLAGKSTLALAFDDNRLSVVMQSNDPPPDVFLEGHRLCDPIFDQGGEPVAAWTRKPERRYIEGWRSMVQGGGAEIGCVLRQEGRWIWAGAAHDSAVRYAGRGEPPSTLLGEYLPMDWRTSSHCGDRVLVGNTAYVVKRLVPAGSVGTGFLEIRPGSGARYIQVEFSIENGGKRTATALAGNVSIIDHQGREFLPAAEATAAEAAKQGVDLIATQLQPGLPKDQVAVFEVPSGVERFDLVLPGRIGDAGSVRLPFSLAPAPAR